MEKFICFLHKYIKLHPDEHFLQDADLTNEVLLETSLMSKQAKKFVFTIEDVFSEIHNNIALYVTSGN